jgi:hypothetical protein
MSRGPVPKLLRGLNVGRRVVEAVFAVGLWSTFFGFFGFLVFWSTVRGVAFALDRDPWWLKVGLLLVAEPIFLGVGVALLAAPVAMFFAATSAPLRDQWERWERTSEPLRLPERYVAAVLTRFSPRAVQVLALLGVLLPGVYLGWRVIGLA